MKRTRADKVSADGSKSVNGQGAACYDASPKKSFMFRIINHYYSSIMTLELVAILEAMNSINN